MDKDVNEGEGSPEETDKLRDIHEEAILRFDDVSGAVRDEREQSLEDRRFYSISGAPWEGKLGEQFYNKPKFEVNKVHLSVIRIINEYRNNRISVRFMPKDGVADDDLADMCAGLYRADEYDSAAEEAYDNAFEEAVGGGMGAWRLRACYEDEYDPENEHQRIRIEPIYDADTSVYFDLDAKRQDKADAQYCFVLTSMTPDAYETKYGENPSTWDKSISDVEFDWVTADVVYVAEYYVVDTTTHEYQTWRDLAGVEKIHKADELDDEKIAMMKATGSELVRTRKVPKRCVRKYILDGARVIEDCGIIAGTEIPIIPVYGKRWFVDNVERFMGHVRLAKDVSRLKNMQISRLAEISALSPIRKPMFAPEQVAGHQQMWAEDNIQNYPYLLINILKDVNGNPLPSGPVGYTEPPDIPQALAALLQLTEADIQDVLGNQQQGEEIVGGISTETAMLVQNRLDMQTYIYMSNMAKAVKRCGEVWLSMAKDIMVEPGRRMKAMSEQGEPSSIVLGRPVVDPDTGEIIHENDFSRAHLDVVVDVGPSSSTKRAATVRALTNIAATTDDPETKQVLGAMAMMNMEGEGIGDVRKYFRRKLINMKVIEPTDEELKTIQDELQNTPPDPNQKLVDAAAEQALSEAREADSRVLLNQARTDSERADAAETLSKIEMQALQKAIEIVQKLGPRVDEEF